MPLDQLEWQFGLLFCTVYNCLDTAVQGSHEFAVAREVGRQRNELTPDPKLIHPKDPLQDIEDVPFLQYV
jgi:hypothetical protein